MSNESRLAAATVILLSEALARPEIPQVVFDPPTEDFPRPYRRYRLGSNVQQYTSAEDRRAARKRKRQARKRNRG